MSTVDTQQTHATDTTSQDAAAATSQESATDELRGMTLEEQAELLAPASDAGGEGAAWEAMFGEALGGALWGVVSEHVSEADLTGYAQQAVDAMAAEAPAIVAGLLKDEDSSAALQSFLSALTPKLTELADAWLESEAGQKVMAAIAGYVEDHPGVVVTSVGLAGIAAAAAAWLTNLDVPAVEEMFALGDSGVSVGGSIDVGQIRDLAIQAASAAVVYEGPAIDASLEVSKDGEGVVTVEAGASGEATIGDVAVSGAGDVMVNSSGDLEIAIQGGAETLVGGSTVAAEMGAAWDGEAELSGTLRVDGADEAYSTAITGTVRPADGIWSIRTEGATELVSIYSGAEMTEEGGQQVAGAELSHGDATVSIDAARDADGNTSGSAAVAYSTEQLRAELDVAMADASVTVTQSTEVDTGEGVTAGYEVVISQERLESLSVRAGWDDPEAMRTFLVEYAATWGSDAGVYTHQLDAFFEQALGDVNLRLEGELAVAGGELQTAGLQATTGVPVHDNVQLIGTAGASGGLAGPSLNAGLGVQIFDAALVGKWTQPLSGGDRGHVGLELVVPFGGKRK